MKNLLSISALAFAMALAVSGMVYADNDGQDKHDGPPPYMEKALAGLPDKDAALFRDAMKQGHDKDKALFDEMHKMHDDLKAILTAPTFDKSAYIAKSKELEKLHDKLHAHMTENFANAVSQLPQDERKTLADAMHSGHHWHHHHDSDKSGSDNASGSVQQ